jgi:hypothetical protein
MRLFYQFLLILLGLQNFHAKIVDNCRFVERFYNTYSNIFELNQDQTSLTIRPLYALSNQSFSSMNQSLSIGIIYRFADIYLVPVPLLFQCAEDEEIYAPKDCEFTMIDTRVILNCRLSLFLLLFFFSQIYPFEQLNQPVLQLCLFIFKIMLQQIPFHYMVLILNNLRLFYEVVV